MSEVNVAEEAARANAVGNLQKTTVADMLQDYSTKTVTLKSGRVFDIESILPGNLLLNLKSPLVTAFLEAEDGVESDENTLYQRTAPTAVTDVVRQLVAEHVTSVPISLQPQSRCPDGVVSIDRFTMDEIRELFKEMCVLSGAVSFPEPEKEN